MYESLASSTRGGYLVLGEVQRKALFEIGGRLATQRRPASLCRDVPLRLDCGDCDENRILRSELIIGDVSEWRVCELGASSRSRPVPFSRSFSLIRRCVPSVRHFLVLFQHLSQKARLLHLHLFLIS